MLPPGVTQYSTRSNIFRDGGADFARASERFRSEATSEPSCNHQRLGEDLGCFFLAMLLLRCPLRWPVPPSFQDGESGEGAGCLRNPVGVYCRHCRPQQCMQSRVSIRSPHRYRAGGKPHGVKITNANQNGAPTALPLRVGHTAKRRSPWRGRRAHSVQLACHSQARVVFYQVLQRSRCAEGNVGTLFRNPGSESPI